MTFTVKENPFDRHGFIYKNLKIKTKPTTSSKVISSIILVAVLVPGILAFYFGPVYLLGYFIAGFLSLTLIVISMDAGYESVKRVYYCDDKAPYTDQLSKSVAQTMVQIWEFESELSHVIPPNNLYEEVFSKLNRYPDLLNLDKTAATKDLTLYLKNLELLLKTCRKRREDNLLASQEVLHSALEMLGELKKDK